MAWHFNFCAPHIPNDPTINFHRYAQTGMLMASVIIYMVVHTYYKLYGPDPNQQKQEKEQNSENASQKQKASDENSQNHHEDDKSVSIAGGYAADQNSSYVTFQNGKKKKNKKKDQQSEDQKKNSDQTSQKVNINQIQSYFPIVFGHFAISSAFSIQYSPYAQQSIATIIYIILLVVLLIVNSKRWIKTTRVVWGFMCFIICFLVMSGLLEVGQANFNKMKNQCFSVDYKSLY